MNNEHKLNYRARNVVMEEVTEEDKARFLITPVSEPKPLILSENLSNLRKVFVGERYIKR